MTQNLPPVREELQPKLTASFVSFILKISNFSPLLSSPISKQMCAHDMCEVSEPMMAFIDAEVYSSDGSSGADSPVEQASQEAPVEHEEPAGVSDKVSWVCEELRRLRALCSRQDQELKGMEALLGETEEELREAKEDIRGQREHVKFLNQVVACDRPVRSVYLGRYKVIMNSKRMTGCVDLGSWKTNAAADALLYLENVRDDPDVFEKLYGMGWESVLGIGMCSPHDLSKLPLILTCKPETAETIRVINAWAHSRVVGESTPGFREAANDFYRVYWESSRGARLDYPSQMISPLRLAYNRFWGEYRKLDCAGYGYTA